MDVFESNIKLVEEYYAHDNYRVEVIDAKNKLTLICFCSHALYSPFTEEAFIKKIVTEDKYNYTFLLDDDRVRHQFGKIIFCRDLWREWYVKGISATDNSISKVIKHLSALTEGEEIVTLGNFSGGYMATVCGIELKAKAIYTISGQFSLDKWKNRKYLSFYKDDKERNVYFNIVELIKSTDIPIYYFVPIYSTDDIEQYELIRKIDNIFVFRFKYHEHGRTLYRSSYADILVREAKLRKLANSSNLFSSFSFQVKLLGVTCIFRAIIDRIAVTRIRYIKNVI